MIPGEGIEGTQLIPSCAELFCAILTEPTYICSADLKSKKLAVEDISNRTFQKLVVSDVVATPLNGPSVGSQSSTS